MKCVANAQNFGSIDGTLPRRKLSLKAFASSDESIESTREQTARDGERRRVRANSASPHHSAQIISVWLNLSDKRVCVSQSSA